MKCKIIFLIFVFTLSLNAQKYVSVTKKVDEYKSSKLLAHSQWSLRAEYLDNSEVILDHNSDMSVAPASGLKVFTSIAALDVLGENFQFETKLYFDGVVKDSVLNGDVYIVGGGDPSLGSSMVPDAYNIKEFNKIITQTFKNYGVKKITGSIVADNSLYEYQPVPDNWEYIDVGNYYGASSTALTFNENMYYLYFEPGKNVGDPAKVLRTEPNIEGLTFTNFMKTGDEGSGDNGYIYCPPLHFNAILKGTVPKDQNEFAIKGSMPDPPLFVAQYISKLIKENGVEVVGEPYKITDGRNYSYSTLAAIIKSPPLKNIVYILNKRSSNLFAELLLKAMGYKSKKEGSTSAGIKVVEEFLEREKINTDGLNLYDGSGLSRANFITPKMMVELLKNVTEKDYYASFLNSLGVIGDSNDIGFFRNMDKGTVLENNARIKSGVIQGVRSYSGYLRDRNGRTIVFSLIANNFNGSGGQVSIIHREIMKELAKLK